MFPFEFKINGAAQNRYRGLRRCDFEPVEEDGMKIRKAVMMLAVSTPAILIAIPLFAQGPATAASHLRAWPTRSAGCARRSLS